eukprot:4103639-Prymnesium_polylepis.1
MAARVSKQVRMHARPRIAGSWGARCEGRGVHVAVLLRSGRVRCCAHVARRWSGDRCVGSASERATA